MTTSPSPAALRIACLQTNTGNDYAANLARLGYGNVGVLEGGVAAWEASGRPVETGWPADLGPPQDVVIPPYRAGPQAMAAYLAGIHSVKKDSPTLYRRKLRDTVGHGECLMGVFDTYPDGVLDDGTMSLIITKSIEWIIRLKPKYNRLSQIHGDFHPGNIWFKDATTDSGSTDAVDFILLDRSRGPWGEPADDVTALAINYIFFSLLNHGDVRGAYGEGFRLFFDEYITRTGDREITSVVAPFFAFRGAVIANPIFYPEVSPSQRESIFRFVLNVLDDEAFRYDSVDAYLR